MPNRSRAENAAHQPVDVAGQHESQNAPIPPAVAQALAKAGPPPFHLNPDFNDRLGYVLKEVAKAKDDPLASQILRNADAYCHAFGTAMVRDGLTSRQATDTDAIRAGVEKTWDAVKAEAGYPAP